MAKHKKTQKRVNILLPGSPSDTLECGLNGELYLIRRGVTVPLPYELYLTLASCGIDMEVQNDA